MAIIRRVGRSHASSHIDYICARFEIPCYQLDEHELRHPQHERSRRGLGSLGVQMRRYRPRPTSPFAQNKRAPRASMISRSAQPSSRATSEYLGSGAGSPVAPEPNDAQQGMLHAQFQQIDKEVVIVTVWKTRRHGSMQTLGGPALWRSIIRAWRLVQLLSSMRRVRTFWRIPKNFVAIDVNGFSI